MALRGGGYNPRLTAIIVASANFLASLDATVITTAIPQMARAFSVAPTALSIGITVYILVTAALLPTSTWIADRIGARTVFSASIAGFAIASALCGLSHNLVEFVGARALQALAASLMIPVGSLILLRSTEKKDLVSSMAISTTPGLVAPVLGPPIGGFIITFFSWPWVFYLNVPVAVLGVLLTLRHIADRRAESLPPFDLVGFLATGGALASLIYGFDRASAERVDLPLAGGFLALGFGLGACAVAHARRCEHPIVPLAALRRRTFTITSITGGALVRIQLRGFGFVTPLLFQICFGLSAFQAGLLLLGYNGGDLLLKPIVTPIIRRLGFRQAILGSSALSSLSCLSWMAFTRATPFWAMFLVLVVSGMFRSVLLSGLIPLTFADVAPEEIGGATVLSNVLTQVTGALAISVSAVVLNLSGHLRGEPAGALAAPDCRVALFVMAVLGGLALLSFVNLPKDAGAEVSGHGRSAEAAAAETVLEATAPDAMV